MKPFQIIVLLVFGVFLVIGVLIFSGIIKIPGGGDNSGVSGEVIIWGTLPNSYFDKLLNDFNLAHQKESFSVRYVEKDKATFDKPHQYPEGIDYVFGNGEIIVEHGKIIYGPGKK